jgi:hypothetical protein
MHAFVIAADVTLPPHVAALLLIVPLVSAILTAVTIFVSAYHQRLVKSIDITADCHKRYDALANDLRGPVDSEGQQNSLCVRYWELQNAQFDLWELGFLQNKLWRKWLYRRFADQSRTFLERKEGAHVSTITLRASWDIAKKSLEPDDPFFVLMEQTFTDQKAAYGAVHRRRIRKRLLFWGVILAMVIVVSFFVWVLLGDYVTVTGGTP